MRNKVNKGGKGRNDAVVPSAPGPEESKPRHSRFVWTDDDVEVLGENDYVIVDDPEQGSTDGAEPGKAGRDA